MSQNVPERTERMDGMNEYLEEGLAQHDEQDDYEDTELTQAYAQPAATLDSTTVDQETATRTQEEPVKTITHGSRTMDASVRRKTIHPHQIHYAPLDPTFVTHKPKVPLDVAKDRRPPQTSTIKSSDLFAYPGSHDFISHGTGTRGGVGSTTQPQRKRSTIIHDQSKIHELNSLMYIMENQNQITETLIKQQGQFTLPSVSIPVFKGDPLDYLFFMRAFEHGIERKTESNQDRLFFLEQFTLGQPVASICIQTEVMLQPRNF